MAKRKPKDDDTPGLFGPIPQKPKPKLEHEKHQHAGETEKEHARREAGKQALREAWALVAGAAAFGITSYEAGVLVNQQFGRDPKDVWGHRRVQPKLSILYFNGWIECLAGRCRGQHQVWTVTAKVGDPGDCPIKTKKEAKRLGVIA